VTTAPTANFELRNVGSLAKASSIPTVNCQLSRCQLSIINYQYTHTHTHTHTRARARVCAHMHHSATMLSRNLQTRTPIHQVTDFSHLLSQLERKPVQIHLHTKRVNCYPMLADGKMLSACTHKCTHKNCRILIELSAYTAAEKKTRGNRPLSLHQQQQVRLLREKNRTDLPATDARIRMEARSPRSVSARALSDRIGVVSMMTFPPPRGKYPRLSTLGTTVPASIPKRAIVGKKTCSK
jgi:hypothetical protein